MKKTNKCYHVECDCDYRACCPVINDDSGGVCRLDRELAVDYYEDRKKDAELKSEEDYE